MVVCQLPSSPVKGHPGPALFPQVILVALMLACAGLIAKNVFSKTKEQAAEVKIDLKSSDNQKALVVVGLTVGYILLLGVINFYVGTFLFLVVAMQALKPGRLPKNMANTDSLVKVTVVAGGVTASIHFLFVCFLGTPLP